MINKLSVADAKGAIREITVNSDRKVSLMNLDVAIIKAGRSDVSHVSKYGQDIVLNFTNGNRLIFVDYFFKDNKIVIDDANNNELYYITADDSGTLIFNELTEIEALLQSSPDYHWVAIPAVLAALAVPAVVFGTNRGGSHSNHKDKTTDKDGNGLITPAEAKAVEEANKALVDAKQAAQDAVSQVPAAAKEKGGLQDRVDGLKTVDVPAITDKDGNGVADTTDTLLADAQAAVNTAAEKQQAAAEAAAKADADGNGLITPAEAKAVEEANKALVDAKQAAQDAVSQVPAAAKEKGGLQDRVDGLKTVDVPAITDKDGNGVADTTDTLLADAQAAVNTAAEKQQAAAEAAAKADADGNGLITPAEAKAVEEANKALVDAKQAAQDAVSQVPAAAKEKGGLQDRVDGLKTVDVPAITDKDGNGVADTTDTLLADAQAAVNTAAEKQQAAAEAAAKADADGNGLITPAEAKAVEEANKALVDAKQAAQDAVSQVPAAAKEKGGLQDRVDGLKTVDVPAITDKDGNGVADTTDTLLADAQAAVNTAAEKQQAAAKADADGNGLITPAEAKAVEEANKALVDAKQAAQDAVSQVPAAAKEKGGLQDRVDGLKTVDVPAITDKDGNGVADTTDTLLADAQAAVNTAAEKQQAAAEAAAKADADGNGLITPAEAKAVEEANKALVDAKQAAQDAVSQVPAAAKEKGGLQDRVDGLKTVDVPAITDKDGNGVADTTDTLLADAQAAVNTAAEKQQAAAEAAAKADADGNGLITPAEAKAVEEANKALVDAKQAAQDAVSQVPAAAKEKGGLQDRVDGLKTVDVPAITDKDGNGVADTTDTLLADAQAAVNTAAEKQQAAAEAAAKADADGNGLITPAEAKAVEEANKALVDAKQAAQDAVSQVPAAAKEKGGLQDRVDGLKTVDVPAITDKDGNGVADTTDTLLADAQAAVNTAAEKQQAAAEAAAKADADGNGLITPAEAKAVEEANKALVDAKQAAQDAVSQVPAAAKEKGGLQDRVDGLKTVDVPAITDKDGNGVADTTDTLLADAQAAVNTAAEKQQAAAEAAAKADADGNGLITPAEAKAVEEANKALVDAKQAAQDAVSQVPAAAKEKGGLQDRVDGLKTVDVPAITDKDGNGVADTTDTLLADAQAAVNTAAEKQQAAAEAAAKADADGNGLITPAEAKAVEEANKALVDAKQAAQDAVSQVPAAAKEKGGLQDRVDGLKTVDVPAITDKDGNGVADTTDTLLADAQAAVNTAAEKQQAAAEAAAKADADGNGLITPAEAKAVEEANKALVDAKQAAQDAVSQVPAAAKEKGGLQDRVDGLKTVDVPAITDKDGNGVADTTDTLLADAQAAVNTAAEKQQAAAEAAAKADADGNGLITPAEAKAVEEANKALVDAKQAAQDAVSQVPAAAKEKGGLQDRVDGLKTVDVPAITDKDGNGVADTTDTLLADAQAAVNTAAEKQQAAAEAAAKADADGNGLITPAEAKAVEEANKALVDAKQAAQDAVSQVPAAAKEKGGLQDRVDGLKTVDVPAITDKDGNGVADFVKANNDSATYIIPKAAVKPKEVFITGSTNESQSNTEGGISLLFRFGNKPEFAFTVDKNSSGKITAKFQGMNVKLSRSYMEVYKLEENGEKRLVKIIDGKASSSIGGMIGNFTDIITKNALLDLRDLPPGDYKVKALNGGIAVGLDVTEITFEKVSVRTYESPESVNKKALPLMKGDVLKNDEKDGVKTIKVGAVEGKAIATTKDADFVKVKGKYGDLTMFANGRYEYKANNLNVNDIKKENVDKFTYTVQSPELPGKASTALLEITIPKFDANAPGARGKRSLSDDEFTHNPESENHNSNKKAVEGKTNDYGKMLTSGHGQINLNNVVGKEKTSDLKSVQGDSYVPYSEGAWHSDVKPHHEENISHDI